VEWEGTADAKDIQHLMDINRAGRVLLVRSSERSPTPVAMEASSSEEPHQRKHIENHHDYLLRPISRSVWPYVLARLNRKARYPNFIPAKNSANGIYYLMRYGPIFMVTVDKEVPKRNISTVDKKDRQYWRKRKRDPALGGFSSLADFLSHEAHTNAKSNHSFELGR
jgi:hypothetical protein